MTFIKIECLFFVRNKVAVYVDDVRIDKGEIVLADSALNMKEGVWKTTYRRNSECLGRAHSEYSERNGISRKNAVLRNSLNDQQIDF